MGEAAFAFDPFSRWSKPRSEWVKDFTDAEIRRALERLDLDAREQMLLERLCGLSLQKGYAFVGQEALGRLLRSSVRTLRDTTTRLCDRGLLQATRTREGYQYRPQWEAMGLEGPGSERERSEQRPAKSAGPNRRNLPVRPYGSRIRSKTSSSRAHATTSPPSAHPDAAAQTAPSEIPQQPSTETPERPTPQEAREAPEKLRADRSGDSLDSFRPRPSTQPLRAVRAPSQAQPLWAELSPAIGVAMLSALTTVSGGMSRRNRAPSADVEVAEPVRSDELAEAQGLALSAAHTLGLPSPPADLVLQPFVPLLRVPAPTAAVVASPDQLAQVLAKFGPEAYEDVLHVLDTEPSARANPTAAFDALDRLLEMQPHDFSKSAGACYRAYVRKAGAGQLRLAKTHPRGGTKQARLVQALDLAEQTGDHERIASVREQLWQFGVDRRENVRALRQLEPEGVPAKQPSLPVPIPRGRLPAPAKALPSPRDPLEVLRLDAEAVKARLSLRYGLTPLARAELEQELAEIEAKLAEYETRTLEESPHVQQGPQTRP